MNAKYDFEPSIGQSLNTFTIATFVDQCNYLLYQIKPDVTKTVVTRLHNTTED